MEKGSTRNPTMRAPSNRGVDAATAALEPAVTAAAGTGPSSSWYEIIMRTWLYLGGG